MANGATVGLDDVPFHITNPEQIPAKRYYDQGFFDLEREKLWPHVWQMAARLEQISQIGDYVEYRNLDKSVIVVRTKSGVKAFHNACRHRGVQLVPDGTSGNCKTKGFICPFHGWRWNMEGDNTFVFGRNVFSAESLDQAELNLVPCRLETWGGCAFINFDDDAPSLLDCLGPVAQRLDARNVDKLKMEWWYATVLPTNWKLAMEAFLEGYHVMRTHPQLHALMTPEANRFGPESHNSPTITRSTPPQRFVELTLKFFEVLREGMAGQIDARELAVVQDMGVDVVLPETMPEAAVEYYRKVREQIHLQGVAQGLPTPDLNALAGTPMDSKPVEFIFPHYFLLPFFSAMASYRIRPLTPETCIFEIWSLHFVAEGAEHERITAPVFLPYDSKDYPEIPQQDYANLPLQQLGLHAGGFEYMRLSKDVEGTISNYQRLIDGYLAGRDKAVLAAGSRAVNCGFESPIIDIGF